jgi:hypothetical protein
MPGRIQDAQRYRKHAEEIRRTAARFSTENREVMLRISEEYEQMAATLEGIEQTMRTMDQLLKSVHAKL